MARLLIAGIGLAALLGAQEPEDPGRPVLKRGGPAQKREPAAPPTSPQPAPPQQAPAPAAKPKPPLKEVVVDEQGNVEKVVSDRTAKSADSDLIERARETAYTFTDALPNFICDQLTSRYESRTLKPDWKYKDRVQVELVFFGGKEDYRNVRVNGKAIKKGSPEDSGTWSTGEFGTILADIFHPASGAAFRPRGDSTAAGLAARVYDFSVRQENSHWQIRYGRSVSPAYKGAVWIDPKTARVLRIEMNTKQLPPDYQIDTVESTVDYGWVTISGQRYLLPARSENLACYRGTFTCTRNEIDFRNYRKFQVESQVLQVESEITFPEAENAKAPKSKTIPPSITPEAAKPDPTKKK